eukprot:3696186-Amphidinium_carterae.1
MKESKETMEPEKQYRDETVTNLKEQPFKWYDGQKLSHVSCLRSHTGTNPFLPLEAHSVQRYRASHTVAGRSIQADHLRTLSYRGSSMSVWSSPLQTKRKSDMGLLNG